MNKNLKNLKKLKKYIAMITPLDEEAIEKARKRQDILVKPPKSLGVLEDLSIQLAGITGKVYNDVNRRVIMVYASDNGVVCEGVSSAPQSVTLSQANNLVKGITGCGSLAKKMNADVKVYDLGINSRSVCEEVIDRKLMMGTNNINVGPAMDYDTCVKAILVGIESVLDLEDDYDIFGIGEMGIGNTTTSSAVLKVLSGLEVEEVTGKGGGITDRAFEHKKEVIKHAIMVNKPNNDDVIDVLSKVGGLDLASMCGAYLGCAIIKKPVVIDGFISSVAALCSYSLCKLSKEYMIASHESFEIGYKYAIHALGLKPLFNLEMRLGEGSGCPIAFEIVHAASIIINDMATFEEAGIDDGYLKEIREGDKFSV